MTYLKAKNLTPFLLIYIIILLFPSLFHNLGLMSFINDEAIRANVALEMDHSGNYIVPTLNGEFYYNKPPLFNWILILFARLSGNLSELTFRIPVVISLLLFGLSVFLTQRKRLGEGVAFLSAMAVITCGRILFYDSFRGLIDIGFSWVVYLQMYVIFRDFRNKDFLSLYIVSYLLMSVGFLLKGMPALVFQGITLLVWFSVQGKFSRLFSGKHLAGISVFILIAGAYFWVYSRYNPLSEYFNALWTESTKRTAIDNSFFDTILHLLEFPLNFLYFFLPWTLLALPLIFSRLRRKLVFRNEMTRFFFWVFIANILVYWVSPAIYARYLFMFLPLAFGILFYTDRHDQEGKAGKILRDLIFPALLALIILLLIIAPLLAEYQFFEYFYLKYFLILLLLLPLVFAWIRKPSEIYLVTLGVLLVARLSFNFFVMPHRIENGTALREENGARVAGEMVRGKDLYLLGETRFTQASAFYVMMGRGEPLERWKQEAVPGGYYLVETVKRNELPAHEEIFVFETRIEHLKISLVKILP